jgi:transcriptional regulator
MYQPSHAKFVEARAEHLLKLIHDYPFGTLLTQRNGDIEVNYAPFLLTNSNGDILATHVPRANPVWQGLNGQKVTILFHGPNAYISPSWYPGKHVHGKAVPTWNYVAVHVHATVRVVDDKTWLGTHIEALTDRHERDFTKPWKVSDAPHDYIDALVNAIVGLEFSITQVEGKYKLGQNRAPADQMGVLAGLTAMQSPLVQFMSESIAAKAGTAKPGN